MKILILCLFAIQVSGQKLDTAYCLIPVVDGTSYFNIYNSKGKLVSTVTKIEAWSIPSGGYSTEEEFVNPIQQLMKGYTVNQTSNNVRITIGFLDIKYKPLDPKWIVTSWDVPRDGYNIKPLDHQLK